MLLIEMIRRLRTGNSKVMEEIYKKMYPLLAAEASRTHFMEYDDAMQEYCFALFARQLCVIIFVNSIAAM